MHRLARLVPLIAMCLLAAASQAWAGQSLQTFEDLAAKDQGLSESLKSAWIEAARPVFQDKSLSFDAGRLLYSVMDQATCNDVDLHRAADAAWRMAQAVELGAPAEGVSDMTLYAFVEDLTPREIKRFAEAMHRCNQAGVPVFATRELIRTAKEESWPGPAFDQLLRGVASMAREGLDAKKAALFIIVSMAQDMGTPEQILRDARAALRKAPKVKKAPEPAPPRVALSFEAFRRSVESFLGTPYVWGGETRQGADCSGFTQLVMKENGYHIPRVSRDQAKTGKKVAEDELKLGDLVFFDTKGEGRVTHVGLYLGGNLMVHASSSKGVIIVLFSNRYFQSRYTGARRVVRYAR